MIIGILDHTMHRNSASRTTLMLSATASFGVVVGFFFFVLVLYYVFLAQVRRSAVLASC